MKNQLLVSMIIILILVVLSGCSQQIQEEVLSKVVEGSRANICPEFNITLLEESIADCTDEACKLIINGETTPSRVILDNNIEIFVGGFTQVELKEVISLNCLKGNEGGQDKEDYYCTGLKLRDRNTSDEIESMEQYYFTFIISNDKKVKDTYCCREQYCWQH